MKRFWGWSTSTPVATNLVGNLSSDIHQEIDSLTALDSVSRLTLKGLSEEIIQVEGLDDEVDFEDDLEEMTLMIWDEGFEED